MIVVLAYQGIDDICCALIVGVLSFGVVDLGLSLDNLMRVVISHV